MPNETFDDATDDSQTGFRLYRFELLNWGTFDRAVWRIEPKGNNALLTGDIGSGKSTLVDGLTTLLVPAQRITFNKAAGADNKERSLTSYVKGYYKSEKDDTRLVAKSVALRDHNSYSVLLSYFYNPGFDSGICLAQVFWVKDNKNQPERFYVVAQQPLSITEHFTDFGKDILDLKKRLRKTKQVRVFDSFSQYAADFRRHLGIQNDQALDLFYQTVSMKSVGNLTEFVRHHMLESSLVENRIENICHNFQNLNQAHASVLKAKAQIEVLTPMVDNSQRYQETESLIAEMVQCREFLYAYFANHKATLLIQRIATRKRQLESLQETVTNAKQYLTGYRQQQADLQRNIAENGGNRLEEIAKEIQRLEMDKQRIQALAESYHQYCQILKLPKISQSQGFYQNREKAQTELNQAEQQREQLLKQQIDYQIELKQLNERHQQLAQEINSLKQRTSNIPLKNLEMRHYLCEALNVAPSEIPFAGELLKVHETAQAWEGAIERVLHNFGLSLLVPEQLYGQVIHYVEQTQLKGRVVYYRVRDMNSTVSHGVTDQRLLSNKLSIKPQSRFYHWLEQELMRRFDYICCENIDELRRLPKALTLHGQIKSNQMRHEKDDRHRLDDRSRYVLGWDNREKIQALQQQQHQLARQGEQCLVQIDKLKKQLQSLEKNRDTVRDLLNISQFNEIHWQPLAQQIVVLTAEKQQIEQSSNILRDLQTQLLSLQNHIAELEKDLDQQKEKLMDNKNRLEHDEHLLVEAQATLAEKDQADKTQQFEKLQTLQTEAIGEQKISIENCDKRQTEMREWLQRKLDNETDKSKRLASKITGQMQAYKAAYPQETLEVDADLASAAEFNTMLLQLQDQDLPRHEQRFKTLLNEGTIQDIAMFQGQLDKERQDILDKIEIINRSLCEIEYDSGSYIELIPDTTHDMEIRQFQQDLRACLGDTLSGKEEDLYSEQKFHEVKALIDRFNQREGLVDIDKKWTKKVTDVRNWYNFSASERWFEDGTEKEFYSDSAGKSGGQKEKLAYTILASALAYQFGLKWGDTQSRSFRFVMIDEAFGRGSDESARYGLALFKKLNLQLLIVTPLQKIHVIEDYVKSVHFVHNEGGQNSELCNLTIDAYRQQKQQQQAVGLSQTL